MGSYSSKSYQVVDKRFRCRKRTLLLLVYFAVVVDGFLLWLWFHLLKRVRVSSSEHERHFFCSDLHVEVMLSRASRWWCYSLLHSHSGTQWPHSWDCCGYLKAWQINVAQSCSCLHFHYYTAGDECHVKSNRHALPPHPQRTRLIFWPLLRERGLFLLPLSLSHSMLICP